jgi:integrative and conjugative element protein (TIGR02256 family)
VIFRLREGGTVQFRPAALARMRAYEQHHPHDPEAGGILLAHILKSGEAIVEQVTTPMPEDVRKRFGFTRQDPGHHAACMEAWEEDRLCAIGDWHSHAEPHPTPSDLDLASWRSSLHEWEYDQHALLFVIVGQASIRCWQGHRDDLSIERLDLQKDSAAA